MHAALLPLGALLNLSLVFPDEAPSRFRLALGTGTVETLEQRLGLMREANDAPNAQKAAEILLQLVAALDVHDKITRGHAERVRAYSCSLGTQLRLSREELDRLNWAALLHDIGKLEVGRRRSTTPGGRLTSEWESSAATRSSARSLSNRARMARQVVGAVGSHHERWDGKGYPRGIAGEEIPIARPHRRDRGCL